MSVDRTLGAWLAVALVWGLAGCSPAARPVTRLTAQDAGRSVAVRVGDTVEFALEGNPTTGYMWELAPGAEAWLTPQGEAEFAPASQALGSGGVVTLRYTVAQAGTSPVQLIYHRSFEPDVPPLQTFEFTLAAEP